MGEVPADLPSDATLQWELQRERGFTETGAAEFIKEYKETISFASLDSGDVVPASGPEQDDDEDDDGAAADPPTPSNGQPSNGTRSGNPASAGIHVQPGYRRYPIPIYDGAEVMIEGPFPLSEEDWEQFIAVLNVMKRTLVVRPS